MQLSELVEEVDSLKLKIESQEYQMCIYIEIIKRLITQSEFLLKEIKNSDRGYGFPQSNNN